LTAPVTTAGVNITSLLGTEIGSIGDTFLGGVAVLHSSPIAARRLFCVASRPSIFATASLCRDSALCRSSVDAECTGHAATGSADLPEWMGGGSLHASENIAAITAM
jgi:hypothetical protein